MLGKSCFIVFVQCLLFVLLVQYCHDLPKNIYDLLQISLKLESKKQKRLSPRGHLALRSLRSMLFHQQER